MEEFLEAVILTGEEDDNLIEEGILLHLLQEQREEGYQRAARFHRFNIDYLGEEECKSFFRFTKEDIINLTTLLHIPDEITTEQRYRVSGLEGLCMALRRLTYPNRLVDLEEFFGLSGPYISVITNKVISIIVNNFRGKLNSLSNLPWLNYEKLKYYSKVIMAKGAPLNNCWGFIDGTARPICRPQLEQEEYYSGHKRQHCVKYQGLLCPDGIYVSMLGAYKGRRHDAGIFRESNLYHQLEEVAAFGSEKFCIFGDQAYGIRELLLCPYAERNINVAQQNFNNKMKPIRQAVEWGFGKIINEFAFLDFKKNQKLLKQEIQNMYLCATILTNCHTCVYGSQTSIYFNCKPPSLQEYLT